MKQVIFGGHYDLLPTDTTEYNWVVGGGFWGAPESRKEQLVSTGGKLKNLRVKLNDVPGTGTYVFTLRLNGAPTTLTCTVAADGTLASDTTHEVAVTGGDRISLECFPDSPGTARRVRWTIIFEGTTAKESLIPGASDNNVDNVATDYAQLMGAFEAWGAEDNVKQVCPTAGKIKDLYVELSEDPGTAPDAYKFTLRVNGVNTDLTVTITADDTTGNNTADEVVVAAGDILMLECTPVETPTAEPYSIWGMTFVGDTDGESLILGVSKNNFHSSNNYYIGPQCVSTGGLTGTEVEAYQLGQACTLKKLYVALENDLGADGNKVWIKSRINGAEGNLVVEIINPDKTGNDAVNTDVISDDNDITLQADPFSVPEVGKVYWGLVGYIAAAPPPVEEPKHTFRLHPRPGHRMEFHPNLKLG